MAALVLWVLPAWSQALQVPVGILAITPTDLIDLDLMPVDSRRFHLTTDEGTVFVLSQDRSVESIPDRNGNWLTVSDIG